MVTKIFLLFFCKSHSVIKCSIYCYCNILRQNWSFFLLWLSRLFTLFNLFRLQLSSLWNRSILILTLIQHTFKIIWCHIKWKLKWDLALLSRISNLLSTTIKHALLSFYSFQTRNLWKTPNISLYFRSWYIVIILYEQTSKSIYFS